MRVNAQKRQEYLLFIRVRQVMMVPLRVQELDRTVELVETYGALLPRPVDI